MSGRLTPIRGHVDFFLDFPNFFHLGIARVSVNLKRFKSLLIYVLEYTGICRVVFLSVILHNVTLFARNCNLILN